MNSIGLRHDGNFEAQSVRFRYGSYGKPELIIESCNEELCFNVSHSHGLALYAISLNRQVGVDIERLRSDFSVDLVARQFFSKRENLALSAMAPNEKLQAFFACWTRKEAYIKAKGKGLSIPLDQFDVSINPKDLESPLRIHGDPLESCRWSLQSLNPGHGYFAAVAAEKRRWRLKCWQWHPESMERPGTPVPAKECGK